MKISLLFNAPCAMLILLMLSCGSNSDAPAEEKEESGYATVFEESAAQYKYLGDQLEPGEFPKTFINGKLETSNSGWWCSGFYPGTLIYLYEETKDSTLLNEAKRIMDTLKVEQFNTYTHDLGFMMFCSFGNMYAIDPQENYREILLNSARSLSTRYDSTVQAIKSWDSAPEDYLVIIDNMMNLELLMWAFEQTGDSSFYDISVTHANTTIQNHFRDDYSTYHVLNYDPSSGGINEKKTAQGFSDESAWARGQMWGLYGFTVMYRLTRDEKYLDQAVKIADFVLNHPNMPEDMIPYWDFNAPDIPDALRDASAAAILASGLLELQEYANDELAMKYTDAARTILHNLSSETYRATGGENGGFIIRHGVGHKPQNSEVDVPLTYGDYYYIEGMKRLKSLEAGGTISG